MNSQLHETRAKAPGAEKTMVMPSDSRIKLEQENARLRLALRESRHRAYNQWQQLIGLAEMESLQSPQTAAFGCNVRLCTTAYAFMTLNRTLDTNPDVLSSEQAVYARPALEKILTLLQAATEEGALDFAIQDAWLSEIGCAALMLICTELVCNAAKYGRKRTQVTFRVRANQGILEVRDDGPGFPPRFRVREQGRQGLQLVEALCHFDLNGEMSCWNDGDGGVVTVTFAVSAAPEATPAGEAAQAFCGMEGVICFD